MRKLVKIFTSIILLMTLSLVGFLLYLTLKKQGIFLTTEEKYFYQKIKEFKDSGKETILLVELTNFEWDEVIHVGPYSRPDIKIRKELIFNQIINNDEDGKSYLLFMDNKKEKGTIINISRNVSNYKLDSNLDSITNSRKVILVNKTDSQTQQFYIIKPIKSKYEHNK